MDKDTYSISCSLWSYKVVVRDGVVCVAPEGHWALGRRLDYLREYYSERLRSSDPEVNRLLCVNIEAE